MPWPFSELDSRRAQDSKARGRAFARAARAAVALALGAASCVQPPSAAVRTPYGVVRADTESQARELAETLVDLRPRVAALLPDSVDRSTEVWLDERLRGSQLSGQRDAAALTNLPAGRIQLRGDTAGIELDFLLAHELVHALMGDSWDPLPAVMKEGLCDTVAARLAERSAPMARAMRLFAARFAFGDQTLDLALTDPGLGGRWGTRIDIGSPGVERRLPMEALELRGGGVPLHAETQDEDALYGYGLLIVERTVRRIGIEGLHELCLQATAEGLSGVPDDWLLWAGGLDRDPATWDRALAEAFGEPELNALTAHLASGLAEAIVSNCRYRYPDFTASRFLGESELTLGLHGGQVEVGLESLPALSAALLREWDARRVQPLRPGETRWYVDRLGLHMGGLRQRAEPDGLELEWIVVGAEQAATWLKAGPSAGLALLPAGAPIEARLALVTDAQGPLLVSSHPDGFEQFRVEVGGVVVADLSQGLNAELSLDSDGWSTVRSRLDPAFDLRGAVLYDPAPNLIVSQRPSGRSATGRWPFRVAASR